MLGSGILKPGMKLLDLGCGPGLYAERLVRAGIEVVGVDISENSLASIKKVIEDKGFETVYVWNHLTGEEYSPGGDWIAIAV